MRQIFLILVIALSTACGDEQTDKSGASPKAPIKLQLNWFHDPTFSGEYKAKEILGDALKISEGGVNVSPIQRLKSGLADVSVVGIDIALKAIEADLSSNQNSQLRIIYVDFQRNPVGWIVHPKIANKYGMDDSIKQLGSKRNDWLFEQFRKGNIRPGDKRGTETTAVWTRWRDVRGLSGVNVTAVGFDPTIMLDAPNLAYPVYMNEEPFKLSERIGNEVVVFDPADDQVELYGNVLLATADVLETRSEEVQEFLDILVEAWRFVKEKPEDAVKVVRPLYPDVSEAILQSQIKRTTDFVFYGTDGVGQIDLSEGGRLDQTIHALKSAGALGQGMSLDKAVLYVVPYAGSGK